MSDPGILELQQQLAPSREPLPPQRWGFLPTEQFWNLASFTPIAVVFWLPVGFFYEWILTLGWPWWQNGLSVMVFATVWSGVVERGSRKYLARRRLRALTEGTLGEAQLVPSSAELVSSSAQPQKMPIVATREFWHYAFARLFGRARGVAFKLYEFVIFMAFFYPSALVWFGAFSLLLITSLSLGAWQRRVLRRELEAGTRAPGTAFGRGTIGGAVALLADRSSCESFLGQAASAPALQNRSPDRRCDR